MAKRKDAPSSVLTRPDRKTSTGIQASTIPLNTRKSPRFQKQMQPAPSSVKKKPEKSEKQMVSTPLRSERGKNTVDVHASNVKSTEISTDISGEIAKEGNRDSNGGSKKRKRYQQAVEFKTRKSPRFQKQMGQTTPSTAKTIPEKSEKQMVSTPLRRSVRGRNPVDVPASNVTSIEKSADITEEIAVEGSRDSNGGSKKRKRYHAVELKARKSPRFQKQMGPTTRSTIKMKPEKSEKQILLSSPLRRSERGKNPVDVPASNVKSIDDGSRDSNGGSKKQKRYQHAVEFKAFYKPQEVRVESFALAKEHLNFSCKEEEANHVYEKLKKPKEMFLQSSKNLELLHAFKDRASRPEEPRMSPAVSLNQQEQTQENHGSSNEEALQSSGQILEEDIARKERNEIEKFNSEWDKKTLTIVNNFILDKSLISYLHGSNSSVRSEMLNLAEKEYADKLNEHERLRQVYFNDLKAMLKADVGQVVVNDEISSNAPAHETQTVDLMESDGRSKKA